ncbi:hypothetical protein SCHPADRAFT_932562 [Schizopora paradoxa]|uniref:F-box domain-containing protein n=1 Tax=Schizopora paradoxa TaxID=27342 RepID=A0A0H2RCP3_9AGAM|nr:hypothetical protein SCHPADRAFT_932562 [Schizopora paradoxa]
MTSKTSWRKLNDDGQDVCRSIDYIVDGIQVLKEFIRKGQRMDGEGDEKVNLKRIWKFKLFQPSVGLPVDVEAAKASLRTMKDAKRLLTSLLDSIDDPIEAVTKTAVKDIHGAGLKLLPDDVLAIIFEMHVGACEHSEYGGYTMFNNPSLVISSICQRFRQLALRLPDIWKLASLSFPTKTLLLYKERCLKPILIVSPATAFLMSYSFSKIFDAVHPPNRWRELHLHFDDEDQARLYYERLDSVIGQTPLEGLEYLSIRNDLSDDSDQTDFGDQWLSMYLPGYQSAIVSSWQMPTLTHLKLRNVLSRTPLRCEHLTWFCFEICDTEEELDFRVLQSQLQSMPKLQSLSVTFSVNYPFDIADTMEMDSSPSTPNLTSLELKIGSSTPDSMITQFMALVDTQGLTQLKLKLQSGFSPKESVFDAWVHAIFTGSARPFDNVEHFTLNVTSFRGSDSSFDRIFTSLQNVQDVSLVIPHVSDIEIRQSWISRGMFQRLGNLLVEVVQVPGYSGPIDVGRSSFDALFEGERCKDFERLEVRDRSYHPTSKGKAYLQRILGDKLQWIDYQSSVMNYHDDDF